MALLGSLLILDRRHEASLELQATHSGPTVHWSGNNLGPILPIFHRFSLSQGWISSMPKTTGLTGLILEALGRALGIATRVNDRILLDEALFLRLQDEPEARMTYESLLPLTDRWHTWLTQTVPANGAGE